VIEGVFVGISVGENDGLWVGYIDGTFVGL